MVKIRLMVKHIDPLILHCLSGMLLKAGDVQKRQVRIPLSPPTYIESIAWEDFQQRQDPLLPLGYSL
jgi:hypothetical protein